MKRNILIFIVLLCKITLFGQTVNLQLGASFSKLKWENSMIQDVMFDKNVIGFDASLGIEYLNFKYFNLSSGLGFIQKGGKDSIMVTGVLGEDGSMAEFKIMLNYLTINTVVKLKVPIKNFITPYIIIGPRLDYLISYKEDLIFIKQFDEIGKVNKFIYGFITGAGININIRKIQVGVVFDYYFNFNKLVDYTADKGVRNKISDRTVALNLLVGYKL